MGSGEELRVAISQRVVPASGSTERRDALDQEWAVRLETEGCLVFPVPNRTRALATWMDAVEPRAVLLTGGNTPVGTHAPADPDAAPERDALEEALVDESRRRGIPLVGICRGAQVINLRLGGALSPLPDPSAHVATRHRVRLASGVGSESLEVNSFHAVGLAPGDLAPELVAFAWSDDEWVEAFHHRTEPIAGLLWHPEREGADAEPLRELFAALLAGERPWLGPDEALASASPAKALIP